MRDEGHDQQFRDCPGCSGTVGTYAIQYYILWVVVPYLGPGTVKLDTWSVSQSDISLGWTLTVMLGTLEWSHSDSGLNIQVAMGYKFLGYVGCKTYSGVGYLQGTTLFVICAAQKNKYMHFVHPNVLHSICICYSMLFCGIWD